MAKKKVLIVDEVFEFLFDYAKTDEDESENLDHDLDEDYGRANYLRGVLSDIHDGFTDVLKTLFKKNGVKLISFDEENGEGYDSSDYNVVVKIKDKFYSFGIYDSGEIATDAVSMDVTMIEVKPKKQTKTVYE